jgi:tetratricopeptide (TPR) repeat protein
MTEPTAKRAVTNAMRVALFAFLLACRAAPSPTETAVVALALPSSPAPPKPKPETRDDKGHTPTEWIALGDDAFAQTKLVDAARFYQEALRADSQLSGYAYYKLGFIRWNQNDGAAALDMFMHAIRSSDAKISAQASRDIVPVYAQYGRPEAAYDFFRTLTSDPLVTLIRLEREYEDVAKPDAAKKVRAQIAAITPHP